MSNMERGSLLRGAIFGAIVGAIVGAALSARQDKAERLGAAGPSPAQMTSIGFTGLRLLKQVIDAFN